MANIDALLNEVSWKAVRSSGAGGQHVNKTSSKVVLTFSIDNSPNLSYNEKQLLIKKLQSRLTTNYELILDCSETRSQHKNKELVFERFKGIILAGLIKPKKRKNPTCRSVPLDVMTLTGTLCSTSFFNSFSIMLSSPKYAINMETTITSAIDHFVERNAKKRTMALFPIKLLL